MKLNYLTSSLFDGYSCFSFSTLRTAWESFAAQTEQEAELRKSVLFYLVFFLLTCYNFKLFCLSKVF